MKTRNNVQIDNLQNVNKTHIHTSTWPKRCTACIFPNIPNTSKGPTI